MIPAVDFDCNAAAVYAEIRMAAAERLGDALDKLIASHAKSLNLKLVTNNLSDFQAYPDLVLDKLGR
ncbi:MAG: hypothetical protein AAGG02_19670 [Cyanobacteria bacterium P01_H01_bin.15]